jgi:hypothetical protein
MLLVSKIVNVILQWIRFLMILSFFVWIFVENYTFQVQYEIQSMY